MRGIKPHASPWRDPWIAAALLAALALRIAMARGGLWLDEAWSAVMAHDVGTPLGVILGINHDNNHVLNSWWLQLVGIGAPPLLARLLSVACSAATIIPAAAFAARRDRWAGRVAAWLFALSPMLVLLGSEARGYAPALLGVVLLVEKVDPRRAGPPLSATSLALIGVFGTLGHLLMVPAIILVGVWLWLATSDWRAALRAVAPALLGALFVVAVLFGSAYAVKGGMTLGARVPFSWPWFGSALIETGKMTLGIAAPLGLVAILIGPRPDRSDGALWLVLGLGLPLAAAVLHLPNSQISRYYVMSSLVLLWALASRAAALFRGKPWQRAAGVTVIGATLLAMTVADGHLVRTARGESDLPVRIVAADKRSPGRILIAADPLSAVIVAAAAEQRVAVTAVGPACVSANYLLAGLFDIVPKSPVDHCGARWLVVDYRLAPYRDGAGWVLYRRAGSATAPPDRQAGLPAPGPVASGPRPAL